MIITTLVENRSISEEFGNEHGLSLYIETGQQKLLFDLGESNLFLENAKILNKEISDIDYLVISHGHYDHGGGLKTFFKVNQNAEVFIHRQAFEKYYATDDESDLVYIGLDESFKAKEQITATSDRQVISDGIQLFSNVIQKEPLPSANRGLLAEENGKLIDDSFAHEQNLLIEEDGKFILFTGCAHNGIINIIEHFKLLYGRLPDYVIGGFHLSRSGYINESNETIDRIAEYLLETKAKYYTCHCTGVEPYERLKAAMGESIYYLKTGSQIVI